MFSIDNIISVRLVHYTVSTGQQKYFWPLWNDNYMIFLPDKIRQQVENIIYV